MGTNQKISQSAAARLRAEMARQKRSGVDLAKVLHISQQSASRRINGDTALTLDELAAAAEWLGLSVFDLLKDAA
jgi:transcriptional regulator with XRE-family HTH domain